MAGFTLIETLVVMIVVGLLAALAVVSLGGGNQQRELEEEVRELFLLIQTAADQAVVNNQEIGLVLDEERYRFVVFDEREQEWESQGERLFRPRSLPDWMGITPTIDNNLPRMADDNALRPDIVFYSSGESTPFELEFSLSGRSGNRHRLVSDGLERPRWVAPGDEP